MTANSISGFGMIEKDFELGLLKCRTVCGKHPHGDFSRIGQACLSANSKMILPRWVWQHINVTPKWYKVRNGKFNSFDLLTQNLLYMNGNLSLEQES